MRFLPVALLGLASLATAKLSTWNDVVGNVPQCMKTCMDEYYTNAGLEDQCGSPDEASVDCLCGAQDSFDDVQEAASDLSSCISSGCDAKELQDAAKQLSGFTDRYTSLASQCSNSGKLLFQYNNAGRIAG